MNHDITLLLELDEMNCSLLRLISSFIMNSSDFTIDEMDEFKFLLYEILNSLKKSIMVVKPIQITFHSSENDIETTILVETNDGNQNYKVNQKNNLYRIAQHLLSEITFDDSEERKLAFTLRKVKREMNG